MATRKTKTAGAIRAGNGKYHFRVAKVKKVAAGTGYSTSHGGVIEGARMLFGYIHKPRGTGSRMHSHANEQFNYVVKGTLKGSVNGKLALKDLSQGIIGKAVDGTMAGPHYEPGFEPKLRRKTPARAAKR
ncbi:MAG: cupin domain-containing protein [Betaproteobacteria bacterium]|nr:cupin domain-containing protein [Betaproteobacteria bacterium]